MIVAENPRFVFVHVFKTGGTSIKRALRRHAMSPWQEYANVLLKRVGIPQFGPSPYPDHLTASKLIKRIGREQFDSYFSFSFVRNPWDREVSHYKYICRSRAHADHETVRSLSGFGEYLRWRCDNRFRQQVDYLNHEGERVVNFVGRFEKLNADFRHVCQRLGLNHKLPVLNRTNHSHYSNYYTEDLAELIRQTYCGDISEFGYEFQRTTSSAA